MARKPDKAGDGDEAPPSFVIRFTRRATADVQRAWEHFADTAGEAVADDWQRGLEGAIANLAQMPEMHPAAEMESERIGFPVRKMVYRRTRKAPAYQVFFRVIPSDLDAPTVQVVHVRHGSQAPLSVDEAGLIADAE